VFGALSGAAWPVKNVYQMFTADPRGNGTKNTRGAFSNAPLRPHMLRLSDHIGVQAGSLPKLGLAWVCHRWTVDMHSASLGFDFSLGGWASMVVLRDLFLMVFVCGLWDWLLYFSPLKQRLAKYKLSSQYPDLAQFRRDAFWTLSATLLGSLQEVLMMRWWASGSFVAAPFGSAPAGEERVPWNVPFFGTEETADFSLRAPFGDYALHFHPHTLGFLLWTATMFYWRITHFYFLHRGMHPWFDRKAGLAQGDIGAFLYRWVHAHHHKSYNPTAFSGISMTPVESIGYLSAALIPLLFRSGCHPFIVLYTKLDLVIGAQIGHDGFDEPGGASYYHQLHHAHFECNYGDAAVPLDWLFGTFEDGSRWAGSDAGHMAPEKKIS